MKFGLAKWLGWTAKSTLGGVVTVWLMMSSALAAPQAADADRWILKLKDSVELSAQPSVRRLEKEGERLSEVLSANGVESQWLRAGLMGTHVLRWPAHVRPDQRGALLNRLQSDPRVEFAEPDALMETQLTPNDPNFSSQWALQSVAGRAGARFDRAWDLLRGSATVVVAVVDTGVVYNTPELAGRLLPGYDFVSDNLYANDGDGRDADASDPGNWVTEAEAADNAFRGCVASSSTWHGTFVAGQIAANTQDGLGVAGADWNTKILPVRASGKCVSFSNDMFDAMAWAAGLDVPGVPKNPNPAQVINVSLGASARCSSFAQSLINRIRQAGALVVVSAGNGGGEAFLPANCEGVLSVGAVDRDGSRAFYSAIGPTVDLAAPGGYFNGLLGVGNGGLQGPTEPRMVSKTGTSFAAPLVAAAAALVKAANPGLQPDDIAQLILNTTQRFLSPTGRVCSLGQGKATCDCAQGVCGQGMLDAHAAVRAARGSKPLANASVSPSGVSRWKLDAKSSSAIAGRSMASYRWEQVAGPTMLVAASAEAELDLPAPTQAGDWVFKLRVTDSAGEQHDSFAALRMATTPQEVAQVAQAPRTQEPASAPSAGLVSPPSGTQTSSNQLSASTENASGGGGGGSTSAIALLAVLLMLWAYRRDARQSATR